MTSSLYAYIGATDYGPHGLDIVEDFEMEETRAGIIGQGVIRLRYPTGGAISILARQEVRFWTEDPGAAPAGLTHRDIGGFVSKRITRNPKGTNLKLWEVPVQDYNVLALGKSGLVGDARDTLVLVIAAAKFRTQMEQVVTLLQAQGGSPARSITLLPEFVSDLAPSTILPAQRFKGLLLGKMLDTICAAYYTATGDTAGWHLGTERTVGSTGLANFGAATLYAYSTGTLATASYQFNTALVSGYHHVFGEWERTIDALDMVQWQQSISDRLGVFTAASSTSQALYPNPYAGDGYWRGEPLKDSNSTTSGDAENFVARVLAGEAFPLEQIRHETDQPVQPGEVVTETAALEGLADIPYVVAEVRRPATREDKPAIYRRELILGTPVLEMGDTNLLPVLAPPHEGDPVAPEPPTSLAHTTNVFDGGTRLTRITYTWTRSVSTDVVRQWIRYTINGGSLQTTPELEYTAATSTIDVPPGAVIHAWVQAQDGHYNYSAYSNEDDVTAAAIPAPDPPVLAFGQDVYQRFGSAYFTGTLTPPSVLPDEYHLYSYRAGGTWQRAVLDPGTISFKIQADIGPQYLVYVKSATRYGDEGLPSNTIAHIVPPDPYDNPGGPGGFDSQAADAITATNPGFTGWPTVAGAGAVTRNSSVTASGAASAAQALTAGQGSGLTSRLFPTNDSARVVLRLKGQRTATSITPAVAVASWNAAGTALATLTPTLPPVAVGSWTAITLQLDLPVGAVRVAITLSAADGGISGTQTLYWSWGGWDVRREDIDIGVITTPDKIAPHTDDANPQYGYNAATLEAAWSIYRSSAQKIVLAAMNEATAGPNGFRLQDAYGNALDMDAAGVAVYSAGQIRLTAMLALQPTHTSLDVTLTVANASVVADCTGGTAVTLTLPALSAAGDGLYLIRNYVNGAFGGGGVCTVKAGKGEKIDTHATITLNDNEMIWIVADTTGWWTIRGGGTVPPVRYFTNLLDVPGSYSGASGKVVAVNGAETGLEFVAAGGGGGSSDSFATRCKWENT